jgi:hypothetical protein
MITMTLFTAMEFLFREGLTHSRFGEILHVVYVALAAHLSHRSNPRWDSTVVAVTIVASRCTRVLILQECDAVDASRKVCILARRDAISLHMIGITVAFSASCRYVDRVDAGSCVVCRQDRVNGVAARANGDFPIPLAQLLAMNARPIPGLLIGGDPRLVMSHKVDVGVASPAEHRHFVSRWNTDESSLNRHRYFIVIRSRITAMTSCTGKPGLHVDIVFKIALGHIVIVGMTHNALIFLESFLAKSNARQDNGQPAGDGPSAKNFEHSSGVH